MKYHLPTLLFMLAGCILAGKGIAQTLANSPYSYYGIGSIYRKGSSHNRALGGTGIGLRDGYSINNLNPASYTAIAYPFNQLTETGLMVTIGQQQQKNSTDAEADMDFTGLAMWFRMNSHWASVIGLSPYSNVDYHITEDQSFTGLNSQYTSVYQGTGGLSQFYFGLARNVVKNLSLGANLAYVFGPLTSKQQITAASLSDWQIKENTYLHTFSLDLGVQYSLLLGKSTVTLGSTLNMGSRLKGTYSYQVTQNDEIQEEDETTVSKYTLPVSAGFGLSWSRNQQWRLSVDFAQDQWSNATFEQGYQLRDTRRVSFGAELLPDPRALNYLRRISFSAGVFHEDNYLSLLGHSLATQGVTAGFKLPMAGTSLLDFTFEYYVSGNKALLLERYSQISCNISLFDLWFVKRKQE